MKLTPEEAKLLREVVSAIPQVAEVIASTPLEQRSWALEAAERGYVRALLESGSTEAAAQKWTAAVMRRLRRQVAERDEADRRKVANALHEELSPLVSQIQSASESKREAEEVDDEETDDLVAEHDVRDYLATQKGVNRFARRLSVPLRPGHVALADYASLIRRARATVLAYLEAARPLVASFHFEFGFRFAGSLCLGIAAGLVVSQMQDATFQPYLVGLLVSVGVWLLSLRQPPMSK